MNSLEDDLQLNVKVERCRYASPMRINELLTPYEELRGEDQRL
jgi:hypothetical protein